MMNIIFFDFFLFVFAISNPFSFTFYYIPFSLSLIHYNSLTYGVLQLQRMIFLFEIIFLYVFSLSFLVFIQTFKICSYNLERENRTVLKVLFYFRCFASIIFLKTLQNQSYRSKRSVSYKVSKKKESKKDSRFFL